MLWLRGLSAAAAVVIVGAFVAFVARPGMFAPANDEQPAPVAIETTTTVAPDTTTTVAPETTTTVPETTTTTEPGATTTTTEPKATTTTTEPRKKATPTTKPAPAYTVTITAPGTGLETEKGEVAIRAEVSGGMEVHVHGTVVESKNGVVEKVVGLAPGWNEIWVKGYVNGQKVAYDTVKVYRIPDETYQVVITSPGPETETDAATIVVSGEATPGLDLKVGGIPTPVAADGRWSQTVPLVGGWNEIWAKGYVDGTKVAYDTVGVHRLIPETVDFTSNQQWGTCSENPPYDVFWGTATPGHQVKVWSEYGSKTVTVGESGTWEAKVYFEGAPAGTAVDVIVKNLATGEGHSHTFMYTPPA
jgi:hypothetical protein